MGKRFFLLAAALLVAQPVFAADQGTDDQKAAQNALNWDIFLKLYPKRALEAREEGAVGFIVTLDNKGEVTRCQVTHTSGHPLLDEETCQILTLHAQFNADPSLSPSQTKIHEGLIAWKLPASTIALEPPKPVPAAAAPEQKVCKKTVRVGTLAGFERTCIAASEWAKQSDQVKQTYEEIQGKGYSICGGTSGATSGSATMERGMSGAPVPGC
jgi:TonB family protein